MNNEKIAKIFSQVLGVKVSADKVGRMTQGEHAKATGHKTAFVKDCPKCGQSDVKWCSRGNGAWFFLNKDGSAHKCQ